MGITCKVVLFFSALTSTLAPDSNSNLSWIYPCVCPTTFKIQSVQNWTLVSALLHCLVQASQAQNPSKCLYSIPCSLATPCLFPSTQTNLVYFLISLISNSYFASQTALIHDHLPLFWNFPIHPSLCCQSYLPKTPGSSVLYLWLLALAHNIKSQILSLVLKASFFCLLPVFPAYLLVYHRHTLSSHTESTDHLHKNALYSLVSRLLPNASSLCLEYTLFQSLPTGDWPPFKTRH